MQLWKRLAAFCVPSHENAYHPHLLKRGMLLFFVALVLVAESFMAASLVARQSDGTFLSAAGSSISAPAPGNSSVARMLTKLIDDPRGPTNWALGLIAALLLCGVLVAFVVHIDVQSRDALVGGLVVAALALACLSANVRFLSNTPSVASVQNSVGTAGQ